MLSRHLYLLVFINAVCIQVLVGSNESAESSFRSVIAQCKKKLNFNTIAEFRQFVKDLKVLIEDDAAISANSNDEFLRKCLNEKESVLELDELVAGYDRERPCKMSEVAKLENYAKKFLLNNRKALALKFFTLFGVNIGIQCKLNLLAHVKQADMEADQLDFIYSIASPTGWNVLINEYTKKSMKFGTSSYQEGHVINRIAKLVPGMSQVEHLDYLSFDHSMNAIRDTSWNGVEIGEYEPKNGDLTTKLVDCLAKIIESCRNLDQFYVNFILSLARLKELGLVVNFLSDFHEQSITLHKWLAATSFCQLMTRVRVVDVQPIGNIKLEIVHDDKMIESRRKLYSYVAEFDEISDEALKSVWQASVPESQWRQKNQAMFRADSNISVAMGQLKQFIRGLEHGYQSANDDG